MNKKKFFQFLILAALSKWILDSIIISIIFSFILGGKKEDPWIPLKGVLLALIFGIVSSIEVSVFGSQLGLSIFLGIFRGVGIGINTSLSYSTTLFISIAYIFVIELVTVAISIKVGETVQTFLEKRGLKLFW